MDINIARNSHQLAFLIQYVDDRSNSNVFFELANKLNVPEELARTPEYFQLTEKNRFYKMISIEQIIELLKNYDY
jgi:hypothetical protein